MPERNWFGRIHTKTCYTFWSMQTLWWSSTEKEKGEQQLRRKRANKTKSDKPPPTCSRASWFQLQNGKVNDLAKEPSLRGRNEAHFSHMRRAFWTIIWLGWSFSDFLTFQACTFIYHKNAGSTKNTAITTFNHTLPTSVQEVGGHAKVVILLPSHVVIRSSKKW